ncbi:MAG: hypothetical protein ACRC0R_04410 [Cetobacterium sp.]
MQNTDEFLKREKKLALEVAFELIEKPKISMMVVLFPILLIDFIRDSRVYKYKVEFFLKEYMFLKNLVVSFLKKGFFSDDELKIELKKELFKESKYENLYYLQIEECLMIKNYIFLEVDEKIMRREELKTLKHTIDILSLKGDSFESGLKLLKILESRM